MKCKRSGCNKLRQINSEYCGDLCKHDLCFICKKKCKLGLNFCSELCVTIASHSTNNYHICYNYGCIQTKIKSHYNKNGVPINYDYCSIECHNSATGFDEEARILDKKIMELEQKIIDHRGTKKINTPTCSHQCCRNIGLYKDVGVIFFTCINGKINKHYVFADYKAILLHETTGKYKNTHNICIGKKVEDDQNCPLRTAIR